MPIQADNTDISVLDNVVYIEPVSIPVGSQYTLSVKMKNTVEAEGFGFDLYLPEGVFVSTDEDGFPLVELSTVRTTTRKTNSFDAAFQEDGCLRVLAASTNASVISGNDGEVCLVTIQVASNVVPGDYPLILKKIAISDTEAQSHRTSYLESTITITGADDGRIKFSETASVLPTYTAGEKGDVTMTRNLKAGNWSTIVLPFTLTKAKAEAAFGSDVQLAEFSGFDTEYTDDDDITPDAITINFTTYTMTARKGLTGGKPFLIKTSKDIESFEADDVTLFAAVTDVEKTDEYDTRGKFTGSLVKTLVPADGLFLSGNKFWYSTGITNIKAFRGWFELGAVLDKETDFGVKFNILVDGETTRVDNIMTSSDEDLDHTVYDLSGRRMQKPSHRGIYIVNGKKKLVR